MLRLLMGLIALCGLPISAHAAEGSTPFTRDILILTEWFEGTFDNEEQVWFESHPHSETPEEDRVERIHTTHARLDLPEFGDHVFYVEEYLNNDPAEIIRQRFVIFSIDMEERAIRMKQGFFKDAEMAKGAHKAPERLSGLTPEDVFFIDTCDVFWHRVADQYHGSMKPKACVFGEGDKRRYSVHDMVLSQTKYWRTDSTYLVADDSFYKGNRDGFPSKMRKAEAFVCEMHFYNEDGSTMNIAQNLSMFSQGGIISAARESDGKRYEALMREKEYPFYDTRPDFIYFSIRNAGERRSIVFSVNDPDSRTLGMRTKEVGAFCHRKGYEFRQKLDQLP